MARRRQYQANDAAKAASEAARVLQQRGQEVKNDTTERVPEPPVDRDPPENWTRPPSNSPHRRSMEEIEKSRGEVVEEEPKKEEPKAEEPKPEPVAEAQPETTTAEPAAVEPEPVKTVKAKVDGEEIEVPVDEVEAVGGVKAWQMMKAAENRLKKSNDTLSEIRRAQAEFFQKMQEAQKPKEPELTDDQFITERIDKMRFGTPEESAQALREIQSRLYKPVDPNAIIEQATNRFRHDQAVTKFDQEFQDVVTNPLLLRLVVSLRNERIPRQKGPVDWEQFYRAIGNEVRGVAGKPTSQPKTQSVTNGATSPQSDKEARKAATVVNIPTAASRASPPEEEKAETREDLLREMRKKRGLPVD